MIIQVHPVNPEQRKIAQIVEVLKKGGVIIYPTDSVYAFACDINNKNAVEKICQLKQINIEKANFSIVCKDFSEVSEFTKQLGNSTFKLMKKHLPGPFTFILNASNKMPGIFRKGKKTIGIRVPLNNIALSIVSTLGNPIVTSSIKDEDEVIEYTTDPSLIHDRLEKHVNLVIDGGYGNNTATTIVDCTTDYPEIIRQGLGVIDEL